jgi:ATP-dependent DNA ligase
VPAPLPEFIPPMLAMPGEPFDSDEHLFEIKWDGTRVLLYVDAPGKYRLLNRRKLDTTERYPDLSFLGDLPPGTVLDGEIVVMKDGKPDFPSLLKRDEARTARKIEFAARSLPATYVVFDQIYSEYVSIMEFSCEARRARAAETLKSCGKPHCVLSQGITGRGKDYFDQAVAMQLEGVVAKRLVSRYLPGKRTDCWIKIKRHQTFHCAVIGFIADGASDFESLIIAAEVDGELTFVGRVGSGIDRELRARLNGYLWSHPWPAPIIPCKLKGNWVEPGLYCTVECMERTATGQLRAPVLLKVFGA